MKLHETKLLGYKIGRAAKSGKSTLHHRFFFLFSFFLVSQQVWNKDNLNKDIWNDLVAATGLFHRVKSLSQKYPLKDIL